MLKEKRILLVAATGLFLVFAVFTAPLFSIISFTLKGEGFTQWNVVYGGDNNPYQLMQQTYAQGTEPEVEEEVPEGGEGAAEPLTITSEEEDEEEEEQPPPPQPLSASMNIDSTDGDTAPATFLFETSIVEGGTEPYTYSWDFGDGSPQSNEQNTEHTFVNPGTYVVTLTVTDSAGETVSDREEVNVRPATTTTTGEPQPSTNATTPTEPGPPTPIEGPAVEQNQTETQEPVVETISCPPPLRPGGHIVLKSGIGPRTTDPLNQFSIDGGKTWNSSFIVQGGGAMDLINGTQYISSDPDLFVTLGQTPPPYHGDTWYRATFTLPSGFTNPSLDIQIHALVDAIIYLNPTTPLPSPNNQIGELPQGSFSNFQNPPESFRTSNPALFRAGPNTLYFHIIGDFGFLKFQTALDYLANVQYCLLGISTQPPADVEEPPADVAPPVVTCQGEPATIVGTAGNDNNMLGTSGRDVIAALGGNDRISALGGDDLICGDEGDDIIQGDAGVFNVGGNDEIFGGSGIDTIAGDGGNDRMSGDAGDDDMAGDNGEDTLNGDAGIDTIHGGANADTINGGAASDFLDSVDGVVNDDSLDGGPGFDTCTSDPDPEVNCEF